MVSVNSVSTERSCLLNEVESNQGRFPTSALALNTSNSANTCIHIHTETNIHTHWDTHTHTETHTYTLRHTYTHWDTHTLTVRHTHTETHTFTETHIHTPRDTHIETHTYTEAHTHTLRHTGKNNNNKIVGLFLSPVIHDAKDHVVLSFMGAKKWIFCELWWFGRKQTEIKGTTFQSSMSLSTVDFLWKRSWNMCALHYQRSTPPIFD